MGIHWGQREGSPFPASLIFSINMEGGRCHSRSPFSSSSPNSASSEVPTAVPTLPQNPPLGFVLEAWMGGGREAAAWIETVTAPLWAEPASVLTAQ